MYKALFSFFVVLVLLVVGYQYGTYERPQSDFSGFHNPEQMRVLCIAKDGNAESFWMTKPSFEGFSIQDEQELLRTYRSDFCSSQKF